MRPLIVANPHIQAGVPTIRGTRIPTRGLWVFWCAGSTIAAIQRAYPSLSLERIMAALLFEHERRQRQGVQVRPSRRRTPRRGPTR